MSVYTENHTKRNDDYEHVYEFSCSCCASLKDQPESQIEYCKDDRIPGVLVHHSDTDDVREPLERSEMYSCNEVIDPVKNNACVERDNDDRKSLLQESVKVAGFRVEIFQKSVSRTEEEQRYVHVAGVYERRKLACRLKYFLLGNVMNYDSYRSQSAHGHHNIA